jgi:hypothetical protein
LPAFLRTEAYALITIHRFLQGHEAVIGSVEEMDSERHHDAGTSLEQKTEDNTVVDDARHGCLPERSAEGWWIGLGLLGVYRLPVR